MSAPSGTVTIVFTDIQGSTELWEKLGHAFRTSLELHNRIVRELLAAHDGHEVKTEGDAFMAAFGDAAAAVEFATGLQQALHEAEWPADVTAHPSAQASADGAFKGLRVRIGMHTGEPIVQQLPDGGVDYFGPVVNRAARVASAAHGGQVLVSEATFRLAGSPGDCAVTDLGEHRLKGLEQPEHLRQVLPRTLAARSFAPIATISQAQTNLPAQLTSFIGRSEQIKGVSTLLRSQATRLVTLLAPGGTGKTRLALRVGEELLGDFAGGVWFAELTEARDATAVAQAVARALGVPLTTREDPIVVVSRLLQMRKPLLLILDNFEQVVGAAAETVGRWLRESPHLTCLATSRFVLGVAGEREFELPPLSAPPRLDGTRHSTEKILARMSGYDSIQLFVERALDVQPSFALTRDTADDIAGICAALEGLPLAIELAAARVRVMKPAKILQNLGKRFELLKSSRRDLTERQRTLEGAIEWSYELLEPGEREVLQQCAVFHGGFRLEAAEEIVNAGESLAMDIVQSLRDKSFLSSYEQGDQVRFGMLESVREFLLRKGPIPADAHSGHADYFAREAERHRQALEGAGAPDALAWLADEAENLSAAFAYLPQATHVSLALNDLLRARGPFAPRVEILEKAFAHAEPAQQSAIKTALSRALQDLGQIDASEHAAQDAMRLAPDDAARLQAMCRAATVKLIRGQHDDSLALLNDAESLAATDAQRAFVMTCRGPVLRRLGLKDGAERDFKEALKLEQARGNAAGVAINTLNLGNLYRDTGRQDAALESYRRAEEAQRELKNKSMAALAAGNIGIVHLEQGQLKEAIEHFQRAQELEREVGNPEGIGFNLGNRGLALQRQGEEAAALECFQEAESVLRRAGSIVAATTHALNAASLLGSMGRFEDSRRLAEIARQDFESLQMRHSPGWVVAMETLAVAEAGLGRKDQSRVIARELLDASAKHQLESGNKNDRVTKAIRRVREMGS